jgi:Cupin domain
MTRENPRRVQTAIPWRLDRWEDLEGCGNRSRAPTTRRRVRMHPRPARPGLGGVSPSGPQAPFVGSPGRELPINCQPVSQSRQIDFVPAAPTLYETHKSGDVIERHRHDDHQLNYVSTGALAVSTARGAFVASCDRAIWIPAGTWHEHRFYGHTSFHTVGFDVAERALLDDAPAVVASGGPARPDPGVPRRRRPTRFRRSPRRLASSHDHDGNRPTCLPSNNPRTFVAHQPLTRR